jgi:uncharacterized membrane protein
MDTWEVTFEERPNNVETQITGPTNGSANVGSAERIVSTILGGTLIGYGVKKRSMGGILLGLLGGGLVYRGATGHCETYEKLGINSTGEAVARDVHIEKSITVNSAPEELYTFWRNFENLPGFMEGLESVIQLDGERSHWVAKGPGGKKLEWDAEIYNEKENELIAWRSLSDSDITNAGSVHFEPAPGGRGTIVKVVLNYNPPGGKAGALFAKLFGQEPGQLVERNLKRLKQLVETGEIPTIEGQPSGRLEESNSNAERKSNNTASKSAAAGLLGAVEQGVA